LAQNDPPAEIVERVHAHGVPALIFLSDDQPATVFTGNLSDPKAMAVWAIALASDLHWVLKSHTLGQTAEKAIEHVETADASAWMHAMVEYGLPALQRGMLQQIEAHRVHTLRTLHDWNVDDCRRVQSLVHPRLSSGAFATREGQWVQTNLKLAEQDLHDACVSSSSDSMDSRRNLVHAARLRMRIALAWRPKTNMSIAGY